MLPTFIHLHLVMALPLSCRHTYILFPPVSLWLRALCIVGFFLLSHQFDSICSIWKFNIKHTYKKISI